MKKYQSDIIFFSLLIVFIIVSYYLAVVVLPFFLGLVFAYFVNPIIRKIQKKIQNRALAVTFFFLAFIMIVAGSTMIFATEINHDVKRLNKAFITYAENNREQLDAATKKITSYIDQIYNPEELKKQFNLEALKDSITNPDFYKNIDTDKLLGSIDTDAIKESLSSITSFFSSSDDVVEEETYEINWFIVFLSSLLYFIYILYDFNYFESRWDKYLGQKRSEIAGKVIQEFKNTFFVYFKQRGKIVLIYLVIFISAFFIIGVPGALILGIIAGLLCFIPYLQYLTLIPLALGCLVLSMENDQNFFIYFGIILAVFILSSILEELILYPKFIEKKMSMNPVIMMLSLSVWGYVFGLFGILIALPLTSLVLSYVKQMLLLGQNPLKAENSK